MNGALYSTWPCFSIRYISLSIWFLHLSHTFYIAFVPNGLSQITLEFVPLSAVCRTCEVDSNSSFLTVLSTISHNLKIPPSPITWHIHFSWHLSFPLSVGIFFRKWGLMYIIKNYSNLANKNFVILFIPNKKSPSKGKDPSYPSIDLLDFGLHFKYIYIHLR
jgi:hypothetical protein